jgi:REP element-mobilizing transposase RayT
MAYSDLRIGRYSALGMTYHITTVTQNRAPIFRDFHAARSVVIQLKMLQDEGRAETLCYVLMPDHLHWIMHLSPEDYERFTQEEQAKGKRSKYGHAPERFYLSKIMEDYKRHTAHLINELRDAPYADVWQEGFRDDALRIPDAIRGAVQYVILNPVKAGLVEHAEDYPYLAWNADWLT